MARVVVRILHAEPPPAAGPLVRAVADVRREIAERACARFRDAGAADVAIVAGPADSTPFGARLRGLLERDQPDGLVVAGSGALALATAGDLRPFIEAAGRGDRSALANNRYSADVVAISGVAALRQLPDLTADNGLPRWLAEHGGYLVRDLRARWRLQVDVDGPLDALLVGALPASGTPGAPDGSVATDRLARVASVAAESRAELLVAGRSSPAALRHLERRTAARVRALIEERGLRAGGATNARPPASALGLVLDRDGPEALGAILARLSDAALVDTRVLLAHRLGADESAWPPAEDRFASDLLLPEQVADPWLRALTAAARDAPIPVLLGGHTLVGPGLRLVVRRAPRSAARDGAGARPRTRARR